MTARSHIKGAEGSMRLDTHRPIQLEQSCAEEGGGWTPAPRIPRDRPPAAGAVYWGVVIFSSLAFGFLIGWHLMATWWPSISNVLASWGRA